jgi:hypothetical protein
MAKNFQLTHLIAHNKQSTIVYAAIRLSNRETVITKVTDTDVLDDFQQVQVITQLFQIAFICDRIECLNSVV